MCPKCSCTLCQDVPEQATPPSHGTVCTSTTCVFLLLPYTHVVLPSLVLRFFKAPFLPKKAQDDTEALKTPVDPHHAKHRRHLDSDGRAERLQEIAVSRFFLCLGGSGRRCC